MDAVIVYDMRVCAVHQRAGSVLRNDISVSGESTADLAIVGPSQAKSRGVISITAGGPTGTDAEIISEESMITSIFGSDTVSGCETPIGLKPGDGECFDGTVGRAGYPEAVAGSRADA